MEKVTRKWLLLEINLKEGSYGEWSFKMGEREWFIVKTTMKATSPHSFLGRAT